MLHNCLRSNTQVGVSPEHYMAFRIQIAKRKFSKQNPDFFKLYFSFTPHTYLLNLACYHFMISAFSDVICGWSQYIFRHAHMYQSLNWQCIDTYMYANDGGHPSVTSDDWLHMQYAYTSWCIISERKPDGTLLTYQLLSLLEFHSNGDFTDEFLHCTTIQHHVHPKVHSRSIQL